MALYPRASFKRKMIEEISLSCPGVYILWFNKICIYVGKTNRPIRKRLREHWSNCHNDVLKNWIRAQGRRLEFQWECIPDISRIQATEQAYIEYYGPLTNKINAEATIWDQFQ